MEEQIWNGENPWNGLRTYSEGQQLYGRSKESELLADIIEGDNCVVLYGRSGIGKSSLLRAGVAPRLRAMGLEPVFIRFEHNSELSYSDQIEQAVRKAFPSMHDRLPTAVPPLGLWDFFHRHDFLNAEGREVCPVILIDQFEEIYTLTNGRHREQIPALFSELADLLNDVMPVAVTTALSTADVCQESESPTAETVAGGLVFKRREKGLEERYNRSVNYRMVISLREDYLYFLERNSAHIPSIKVNRFCLQALTDSEAMEVITLPKEGLFTEEEAQSIIGHLGVVQADTQRQTDPAILSIFLFKYFNKQGNANANNIISEFYEDETRQLSRASLAYLEDHLLTGEGFRHHIPYNDAIAAGVTEEELQLLFNSRIITREPRNGHDHIEFSHDVLAPVAKRNRHERRLRENARKMKQRMWMGAIVIGMLISVFTALYYQYQQTRRALYASLAKESTRMIREGEPLLAMRLLLNLLPDDIAPDNYVPELEGALRSLCDSLSNGRPRVLANMPTHISYNSNRPFAVSPDEAYIITSSPRLCFNVWDANNGRLVHTVTGLESYSLQMEFNHGGTMLATYDNDHRIRLWEYPGLTYIGALECPDKDDGVAMAFDTDDRHLATLCESGHVAVWDVAERREVACIQCHRFSPTDLCYSADGQELAIVFRDSSFVSIHETQNYGRIRTIDYASVGRPTGAWTVEQSPDGRYLAIGQKYLSQLVDREAGFSRIIDLQTGTQVLLNDSDSYYSNLSFSKEGDKLVLASGDGYVATYRMDSLLAGNQTAVRRFKKKIDVNYEKASFYQQGRRIVAHNQNTITRLWSHPEPKLDYRQMVIPGTLQEVMAGIRKVHVGPDGRHFFALMEGGEISEFDPEGNFIRSVFPESVTEDFCISHDGNMICVVSVENQVSIWDQSGKLLRTYQDSLLSQLEDPMMVKVNRILFSPDDERVLVAGKFGLRCYGVGEETVRCITSQPAIDFAFSQDRSLLFVSDRNSLSVWDANTYASIDLPNRYELIYLTMIPCMQRDHILTGRFGSPDVQNWRTGEIIASWPHAIFSSVSCLSHDKRYAALNTNNGIMIVDLRSYQRISFFPMEESLNELAFSTDDSQLYCVTYDGTIRMLDFPTFSTLVARCREQLGDWSLTPEERERFKL